MQDIARGTQEKIHLNVIIDNVMVQADATPYVYIYDADNDASPISGYSGLATNEEQDGSYSYMLRPSLTNVQRVLKVVWHYSVGGIVFDQEDFYRVSTVYATVSDIVDFMGYGATPSEINYMSPERISAAERVARTIIEGYTNQAFYLHYGSQEQYGVGSDAIYLVEKMVTLDKVWENDMLLIDNTTDPIYNNFGFDLEITPTGKAIRIVNQGWDVRYDNQVDPNILYYGRFRDNSRYKFEGLLGYKYVPEDIKLACMLLTGDILSNDYNWRNKYLKKVNLSEISFEMAGGAFNGTGNVTVDNILDQYRNVNIVII
jgi:hypothetical protein